MRTRLSVGLLVASSLVACGPSGLSLKKRVVFVDAPTRREVSMAVGDAPDEAELRGAPPGPLAKKPWPKLVADEATLPNGVRVVTVARRDFPTVSCVFALDRGAATVPPAAAEIYAAAMAGSSTKYDQYEAFEYLRYVGASVGTNAGYGSVTLTVTALTPLFPSALTRAVPMFTQPKLKGDEVEEAREHVVASRTGIGDDPERRAGELLRARLFPAPHPYGIPHDGGSVDVIRKVHPKAIAQLRDLYLSPEHVTAVCVGDLEHDAIVRMMKAHLGGLTKKPERPAPDLRAPEAPVRSPIVLLDRPGAVQSNVAIGWIGPAASSPDAAALDVLASGVGSGLSSRLNLKVRKELGATYGARMSVRSFREASAVTLGAAIETERTATALEAMLHELDKLREEPLANAELAHAKQRTISGFGDFTNGGVAAALASEVALGQPPTHALHEQERIEAVTSEDVRAAAMKWIDTSRARIVVVGDAAKIGAGLRALGREVEVVR